MSEKWKRRLKDDPVPWLLESTAVTRYRTLVEIVEKAPSLSEVQQARQQMLGDSLVQRLLKESTDWLPKAAGRNNDPALSYFKLRMLADFGVTAKEEGMREIIAEAVTHRLDKMFAVRGTPPKRLQKGEKYVKPDPYADVWEVSPCNSPIITYALLALGYRNELVMQAVEALQSRWTTPQGWFCHFFFVDSQFKKLQIGCPMAGLIALEVFSLIPALKETEYARNAYSTLKFHRDYGNTIYYFGRSRKFWTMKYPFIWYNALYLADVLTRFDFLHDEILVRELIEWIERSQNAQGRFQPTSMYMEYKGRDFTDKKVPSPWITFLCCRILKRWYG
ncbi:MAG: hypothetical protein AB1531_04445 [Chloroflexota bacterium]